MPDTNGTTWNDLDELEQIQDAVKLNYLPRLDPAEADGNAYTDDRLAGRVVGRYEKTSASTNAVYPVIQVLTRDGKLVNVHCTRTVLRRELEDVTIGSAVLIQYGGLVEREDAPSYHRYQILVRTPADAAAPEVAVPADDLGDWGTEQ
jgi:hypothetical protein